ncbi:MAG: hypothetical protein AB7S38_37170 [Vulcanimicrobiota bacterium]
MAVALAALALLALIGVFVASLRLTSQNREAVAATHLAGEILERARSLDYSVLPQTVTVFRGSLPDAAVNGFPPAPYPRVSMGGQEYVFEVRVEPGPPPGELLAVEVVARYSDHQVRLQGYLTP